MQVMWISIRSWFCAFISGSDCVPACWYVKHTRTWVH